MPSDAVANNNPSSGPGPLTPSRITISTNDGLILRAESLTPTHPIGLVVLCHPHPLHGGNMFASVIDTLFHSLGNAGFACLRFNFRGVTGSDGRYEYGDGEQNDIVAAIDHLHSSFPALPLTVAGWSFGADVALAVVHPAIRQWFCVAPPLGAVDLSLMGASDDPRPVLLVVPEHDQFCDPTMATERTAGWHNTTVAVVPEEDHFLGNQIDFVVDVATHSLPTATGS